MGGPKPRPVLERALDKIKTDPETGCWVWQDAPDRKGYGRLNVHRIMRLAHRVVYELLVGPIPDGLILDHLCRNRICVRPDHLEPVTSVENTRRGVFPVKSECPQGHPYDEENTLTDNRGYRHCRECMRARARAAYASDPEKHLARARTNYWKDPERHRARRNRNRRKAA